MHERFAVATGTSVRFFNNSRYWISKQIAIGKTHTFGRGIRLITSFTQPALWAVPKGGES